MDNKKEILKALNDLLQGEYMAVESFNNFIPRIEDNKIKKTFQKVQVHHRNNINTLATYIQNKGGKPDENLGFKGFMGDMKLNMEMSKEIDAKDIISKIIEGETKGINMAEKVLRGNLDNESREVAGKILESDREYLDVIKSLIL